MTNANHKAAIRKRMAATGENYTTAKRAIEQVLRDGAPKPVSTWNDRELEHAVYAAYDHGTVAGFIAQELFSTAVWRQEKAAQYPDDDRNLRAAEHLADLTRQVLALPDSDPRLIRLEGTVRAIADANGELPATSDITSTIGFSWGLPSIDELLDRYTQEHKREMERLRQYVTGAWGDDAGPAAERIREALKVKFDEIRDEVVAAVQNASATLTGEGTLTAGGSWGPPATLSGAGTLTAVATATAVGTAFNATVLVTDEDHGYGTDHEDLKIDANVLSERVSRGGLARLNPNQRILVATILITAILQALPPEVRNAFTNDVLLAAAISAVLLLFKK
jgi:hypothetical protein